jgi:hypothetical protein
MRTWPLRFATQEIFPSNFDLPQSIIRIDRPAANIA